MEATENIIVEIIKRDVKILNNGEYEGLHTAAFNICMLSKNTSYETELRHKLMELANKMSTLLDILEIDDPALNQAEYEQAIKEANELYEDDRK